MYWWISSGRSCRLRLIFFFFNDTATTEIYTLSLHDALPICSSTRCASSSTSRASAPATSVYDWLRILTRMGRFSSRSEEHTSELQSRQYLVCRLLLENKKQA